MKYGSAGRIPEPIKRAVRRRDQVCQIADPHRCTITGPFEYDHHPPLHVRGIARDDPRANDINYIRLVCIPCHAHQTGVDARALQLNRNKRTPQPHFGMTGS
jgi:hypothetical protein